MNEALTSTLNDAVADVAASSFFRSTPATKQEDKCKRYVAAVDH